MSKASKKQTSLKNKKFKGKSNKRPKTYQKLNKRK